jgi:hypothetical protein
VVPLRYGEILNLAKNVESKKENKIEMDLQCVFYAEIAESRP